MLFSQLDPSQCSQFFIQAPLQGSGKDFSKKNLLFHDLLILLFSACFKRNWATSEHCLSPMLCTVSTWAWVLIPIGNFPSPDLKTWVPIHGPFCEPSLRQIKKISVILWLKLNFSGEPSTTNFLEAGHRALDAIILCNHPREFSDCQACPKKYIIQVFKN